VSGLPPLSGFVGKWLILQASLGSPWMPWVIGVLLVTSLLGIMGLARSGSQLFFNTDPAASAGAALRLADFSAPLVLVTAGIAMVVFAGPLYEFSQAAATQLAQPAAYLDAVLQAGGEGVTR